MNLDYDVVISGGGPVGLLLACELKLADVSVVVLERLTEMDQTIKAGSINSPSADALYRRGMLPQLAEVQKELLAKFAEFMKQRQGESATTVAPPPKFAGHFAGMMLKAELFDDTDPDFADRGPAGKVGMIGQQQVELILAERAAALGVEFRRGVTVTGFDADDEGVTVYCGDDTVQAGWLVGCDGGRSLVRRLAGFDFPGTEPQITCHQAMVEMEGAQHLGIGWNTTDTGIYAHGPLPGRILTVEVDGPPADRDAPITAAELQTSIRKVTGVDVTVTAVKTATRFTDNARQATSYRRGRVLLAGDAAHVHSPFGGQGLNLGIGDAMNLGWKLAATIHGTAPADLLDSYTTERHPIGAWVLEWTRAQVAIMRTDPRSRAMRSVVADLMNTVDGTTHLVKKISGVWQRYDLPGDHRLIGASAPDLEFTDGTRLADHMHDGHTVLFDLSKAGLRAEGYPGLVRVVTAESVDDSAPAALLVRPDGIVAWVGDGDDDGLAAVIETWCGAAQPVGV